MKTNRLFLLFFLFIAILGVQTTYAGQFITEDPVTTKVEHVELIPFSDVTKIRSGTIFETPALEANVGILTDFQGHLITPVDLNLPRHGSNAYGYGDIETGFKYRFIQETESMPQVAFYPKVTLPSGFKELGLGLGGPTEAIPFWFLKSWNSWKLSGGGGYTFSQASHTHDYGFGGLLLQKDFGKRFTLGGELYAQGTISQTIRSALIFTFGGNYNFTENFALLFSTGHSIAGQNTLTGYIGLDWTFGAR